MPQQLSPFIEGKYGWNFGESGWNTGMDENLLKFSFMFDRNVDSIVSSLPSAVNGQAHYLTTDNRIYFAVGSVYYSTPVPKYFIISVRSTGQTHQFNGTSLVQIDTPAQTDSRLDAVELTVSTLGTAAFEDVINLATQAELDVVSAQANDYTDDEIAKLGIVSVMDYITNAVDGVTDNQSGIVAAVADAYTNGHDLYWPKGSYVSSANIPNFQDVRHSGPGTITREGVTFYIQPKSGQTNNVYVSTTGNDSNDGISPSHSRATIQSAGNILYNYPSPDANWSVILAAGTYNQNATFNRSFPTNRRVVFKGPDVIDGTIPTAIINSPGGAVIGLLFQNNCFVQVVDIKFTNFNAINAGGVTADSRSDLYTRNVHIDNCYQGIEAASESKLRVQAGVIQNATLSGISCISNTTFTIGYAATAATLDGSNGPAIINCPQGVAVQESATGHCDYVYVKGCGVGLEIVEKSRIHLLGSTLETNTTAVRCRTNSTIYDNPSTPNTFTGNATRWVFGAGSLEVDNYQNARPNILNLRDTETYSTQSTTPVNILTYVFDANELGTRGAGFDLELDGSVLGVANTKTVTVALGATTLGTFTVAATTTVYSIRVKFVNRTATGTPVQKCFTTFNQNGVTTTMTANIAVAEDLALSKNLTVTHQVTNAADTNRINNIDLIITK